MRLILIVLFLGTMVPSTRAQDSRTQGRIGELLIVANGVQRTAERIENDMPYKSPPGFHFVRVTTSVSNAGNKHALCASLFATLETTFNLQSQGRVYFGNSYLNRIFQLLPDERLDGEILFKVKNGVEPLTVVIKQYSRKQGCSQTQPLPVTGSLQVRFPVASIPSVEGKAR